MAKINQGSKAIVTSPLPIPSTESPLVIDLPDGQKIVLGKLAVGTVIEVATWRGTGRPDSRTNRIMLGMSDTTALQSPAEKPEKVAPSNRLPSIANLLKPIHAFKGKFSRTQREQPVEETLDLDIDAWINKIDQELQAKSQMGSRQQSTELSVKKSSKKAASAQTSSKKTATNSAKSRSSSSGRSTLKK